MAEPSEQPRPLADIAFAAAVIAFSGVVYWGTLELPPPRYEPMGSAALPRGLAVLMAAMALLVAARGFRNLARNLTVPAEILPFRKRPELAVACVVILLVYLTALDQRVLGFIPASILAFGLLGCILVHFELRRMVGIVLFTIALILVSYLTFTHLFYVDLP